MTRLIPRRRRRPISTRIEVHLDLDTTAYLAAVERAAEGVQVMRYRERLAHERSLGLAYVAVQLDSMCDDLGLNPVEVWRLPRQYEEQDRRERDALRVRVHYSPTIADPGAPTHAELEAGVDVSRCFDTGWIDNQEPCRLLCCPRAGFHTKGECAGGDRA